MNEYILSIHPAVRMFGSHDPNAVIFNDNQLIFGVEEERLTRDKHAINTFPERAIRQCLSYCDIDLTYVSNVVFPLEHTLTAQYFV